MKKETWKPVPGYEGIYEVSDQGRIKNTSTGRILKGREKKGKFNTYISVALCTNGHPVNYYVHRLEWEAFNGPIPQGMVINHIDENSTNNNLENLMICTQRDNLSWGTHNERVKKTNQGKVKSIIQTDLDGNVVKEWASLHDIENTIGFCRGVIVRCCNGTRPWKGDEYMGYKWKYKN